MRTFAAVMILACAAAMAQQAPAPGEAQRAAALARMARSGQASAESFLAIGVADESPLVRQAALNGLAAHVRAVGPATRAAIRKALADPHPLVVLAAAEATAAHPDASAAAALARLVRRPPPCRGEHLLPHSVVGRQRTTPQEIAEEAFRALGRLNWSANAAIVLDLLAAHLASARSQAALAAGHLAAKLDPAGRQRIVEALRSAMADPSRDVRLAAACGLAGLGDGGGSGVLIAQLQRIAAGTFVPEAAGPGLPGSEAGGHVRAVVGAVEALTGGDWGSADANFWSVRAPGAREKIAARVAEMAAALKAKGLSLVAPDVVPKTLTAADKALLERLYAMGLHDPRGDRRVVAFFGERTVWGAPARRVEPAWQAADGKVFSTWGLPVARLERADAQDFDRELDDAAGMVEDRVDDWASRQAPALAAWACRLGKTAAAARMLFGCRGRAYDDEDMLDALRWQAAPRLYLAAVHAYMVAADGEAQAAAQRLAQVAGDRLEAFPSAAALLGELKRRKDAGTFGRPPAPLPADLANMPVERRIAALVTALEDVAVRQSDQGGGVDLASAPAVAALIDIGDPAVPALLRCVRDDARLTRSVHFPRDFMPQRTILGVGEAALTAVQSILRKSFFSPSSPGDDLTRRGPSAAAAVAGQIEQYWNTYGKLPIARRMMLVLADARSAGPDLREAAMNIATLQYRPVRGTMVGTTRLEIDARRPSPAVAAFSAPTAAEAILKAMDRDLANLGLELRSRPAELAALAAAAEDQYATALMHLGDRRIVPELLKRYAATGGTRMRRKLAGTAHWLGDSSAIDEFAARLGAGKLPLPPGNAAGDELRECLRYLAAARTPACRDALDALAEPNQPYHALAARRVRDADPADPAEGHWFIDPVCLRLLRGQLDDTAPDGITYALEDGSLVVRGAAGEVRYVTPDVLNDAEHPRRAVAGRRCDVAAEKLGQLVLGLPQYHPLLADADRRIAAMKRLLDLYRGRLEPAAAPLRAALELDAPHVVFVPRIAPLGRAAAPADVAAGNAIFEQGGKGTPADGWRLPATAGWKSRRGPFGRVPRVLVVQAEATPDGAVRCGVIARHAILAVPASDLADVRPLSPGAGR